MGVGALAPISKPVSGDPTSAALPALVVVHGAMSTTGPVRQRNEDHIGWGRLGAPASDVIIGSQGDVAPIPLIGLADAAIDTWWPLGSTASEPNGAGMAFVVADGLGGYGGGDVASWLAARELLQRLGQRSDPGERVSSALRGGFNAANQRVFDAALSGEGARRMQTTLSALVLISGEAHIGHVGDTRIYRLRGDMLDLLTTDHSQVMEMLRMRLIRAEQAADHPARHALTRSLGSELTVRTDIRVEPLSDGDTFLLCSDGLWSKVETGEIREALHADVQGACEELVTLAIGRGGDDNASAIVVRVEQAGVAAERPRGWRRFLPS